jgi:imidazolonepropionase
MASILITHIQSLAGIDDGKRTLVKGADMQHLQSIQNAYLHIVDGKIHDFGTMDNCPITNADTLLYAHNQTVLPCWCDSHTHIVYAGSREQEFEDRIHGLTYEQIAERGGGILNSANKLNQTPPEQLFDDAYQRLLQMRAGGTGAVEIKSGYGLSLEGELKMLRVIKQLKEQNILPIKATFLGAHAIPLQYKQNRQDYINLLTQVLIPQIAHEGLADYCDVFCDRGFFTVPETDQILEAGWKYNLQPKIHANELDYSGGVQIGVKHRARSVDHLECMGTDEINTLLPSHTMPTLLPSTAFFLRLPYAPARQLIDAGLPVALASDYNPGSSPSGNMSFVISLSCIHMRMTPHEAIHAATLNSAYAMNLSHSHGSIAIGKTASVFLTKPIPSLAYIPYSFGHSIIDKVIIQGKIV